MSEPRAYLVEGVAEPTTAPAYARPITLYMEAATGSGEPIAIADVTGLQAILDDYEARLAALEGAAA